MTDDESDCYLSDLCWWNQGPPVRAMTRLIPQRSLLLDLAWRNTVLELGQVVIKIAVIPSMNSSCAGGQREKWKE